MAKYLNFDLGKKSRQWAYSMGLIPGIITIWGNLEGGWFTSFNIFYSLGLLGILDQIFGEDHSNEEVDSRIPKIWIWMHFAVHTIAMITLFYQIHEFNLMGWEMWMAVFSTGLLGGSSAVVVAHEMVHKASPWYRYPGQFLLLSVGNPYFYVHHLRIHHKDVATQNDAVTARKGETIYQFLVRAIYQQHIQAWKSERSRLKKRSVWQKIFSNIQVRNYVFLLLTSLILWQWDVEVLKAWWVLSVFAAILLEYVNYIEHYGLERDPATPVGEEHSWNTQRIVSRYLLLDLPRHSHHHLHANLDYYKLKEMPKERVLPGGYASLIMPVFSVVIWFKMINHRL